MSLTTNLQKKLNIAVVCQSLVVRNIEKAAHDSWIKITQELKLFC